MKMRRLAGWVKQWLTSRYRLGSNPWPQPEHLNPWLDRSTALAEIEAREKSGNIDATTADALRAWHHHGYIILRKVIDDARIDRVLADFDRFWREQTVVGGQRAPLVKDANGHFIPYINIHMQSDAVKDVFLDRTILHWLKLILGRQVYGCQTINFFAGSRRRLHHDHVHMTTRPYGYLAASWIALEDIDVRSGPLLFVPGSQWMPYDNAPTIMRKTRPGKDPHDEVADRLEVRIRRRGLKEETFLARKGDVLLWHCNLAHGGAPIQEPRLSRISMACHYAAFGVEYYHEWSGDQRDPSDVLDFDGRPYLPEYYDSKGTFAPSRKELLRREARQAAGVS
jgi:ectoine hydroxylase-related dioxygenase (phytanoyl-CoA dioxygenase family)